LSITHSFEHSGLEIKAIAYLEITSLKKDKATKAQQERTIIVLLKSHRVYATYQLTFCTVRYHNTFQICMDIMTYSLKTTGQIPLK
jgi:hypothetical protein